VKRKKRGIFLDGKEIPREELKRLLWLSSSLSQDWSELVGFLQNASWERTEAFEGLRFGILEVHMGVFGCLEFDTPVKDRYIPASIENVVIPAKKGSVPWGKSNIILLFFFFK
jgi:hypothetical protein